MGVRFSGEIRLAVLASAIGSAFALPAAYAQDPSADEITVTGTRIRRDDYTSTTATQNITAEDMQRLGLVTAADMLAQLPSNVGTYQLDMDGSETSFNVGSTIANLRGMNTAQGTRTLVLVDGQRQVQTTNGGNVDLSFIPSILISRMEAVTGGASAVYGSDATAGVINVILDRNVSGIRLDASFGQNKNGDLRQYSVSVASGINNLLDGKGSLTVSYEHQITDPTASCGEIFEWCARSASLVNTAVGSTLYRIDEATGLDVACTICPSGALIGMRSRLFPDQDLPQNVFYENMRLLHEATTYGSFHTPGPRVINPASQSGTSLQGSSEPTAAQFLRFNQEGTSLVPFQESLEPMWRQYAYGGRTRQVQGGEGPKYTIGSPTRNGQERDQIFSNFRWEATDDINVNARLTYGVTKGEQIRNAPRNLQAQSCIYLPVRAGAPGLSWVPGNPQITQNLQGIPYNPNLLATPGTATGQATGNPAYDGNAAYAGDFFQYLNPPANSNVPRFIRHMGPENGFLDPRAPNAIDPASIQIILDRSLAYAAITNPAVATGAGSPGAFTVTNAQITNQTPTTSINPTSYGTCSINPPTLAGVAGSITLSPPFQARPGINIEKNWSEWLDRRVLTDTDQLSLSVSADGPLFGGDKWTWNSSLQMGSSDREQYRTDQQRGFRYMMAADAVYDPEQGAVVCRVNASDSVGGLNTREILRNYILGLSSTDVYISSVGGSVGGNPVVVPQALLDLGMEQVDLLREGCQPINPFGQGYKTGDAADLARQRAAIEYAFSDQIETSTSDQMTASISLSGEIWKGFGAGPVRMATGFDYRDNDTFNYNVSAGGGAPIVRTDFVTQYGDPWNGTTNAYELFSEFELPLVRDRIGARSLTVNFTGRRTLNKTTRVTQANQDTTFARRANQDYSDQRYGSSWRASLNWSPTDWMRLRATRSTDIRSPSSRELFSQVTTLSGGFGRLGNTTTIYNPWRSDGANEREDDYSAIRGGNEALGNEESGTTTLGVVFSPRGFAQGLQLSADYSELRVGGGIAYLDSLSGGGTTGEEEEDRITTDAGGSLNALPYPIYRCYAENDPFWCSKVIFNAEGSGDEPNSAGLDPYTSCEAATNCIARTDIVAYMNVPFNSEPYWTRNLDLSANYNLRLDGGGSMSIRLLATRALEQSRCTSVILAADGLGAACEEGSRINIIGVTGSGGGSQGFTNYTSQPTWSGNFYTSYTRGPLSITGQARYTGKGRQSLTALGEGDPGFRLNAYGTWYRMDMPSWTTMNLTTSYNFARSRFAPERFENLQLSLTIDNLFDKQPDFYSCASGCTGGVNTRFYNGNGRTFRLNFRSQF